MRQLAVLVAFAAVIGACGEDPLAGVGDLANEVVHEGTTTTFIVREEPALGLVNEPITIRTADELVWLNETLTPSSLDPREVLTAVWDRGRGVTSGFVQAGPSEISLVLPELEFPGELPVEIVHVSSQLVFETSSGLLDGTNSVAFGLWNTVPYSVGRASGQMAVMTVGQTPDPDVADDQIVSEIVADGIALTWQRFGYTYELFCRDTLAEAACWQMATTGVPLRLVETQGA